MDSSEDSDFSFFLLLEKKITSYIFGLYFYSILNNVSAMETFVSDAIDIDM